jgi:regulator of protease activity HflC (stomatin/prohibitin superfamily)
MAFLIVLATIFCVAIVIFASLLFVVPRGTCVVYESYTGSTTVITEGIKFVNPFTGSVKKVDWSYKDQQDKSINRSYTYIPLNYITLDTLPITVRTQDGIEIDVDPIITLKIKDVIKAVYSCENLFTEVYQRVETLISEETSHHTVDNINNIDAYVKNLSRACEIYAKDRGIELEVRIQSIDLPEDIQESMSSGLAQKKKVESDIHKQKFESQLELDRIKLEVEKIRITHQSEIEKVRAANQSELEFIRGVKDIFTNDSDAVNYLVSKFYSGKIPPVLNLGCIPIRQQM